MSDIAAVNNSSINFNTTSGCKTYLETIQQIESLIKKSSSTTTNDMDELKHQVLLCSLFECTYTKDNLVHQNENFMSILKASVPMLHIEVKKYLFTSDNIEKIKIVLNHGPAAIIHSDNDGDLARRFYTNYFNSRDHLVKFVSDEFLTAFKETHKVIYEDLCHCVEILLIALLIHEYETHFAKPTDDIKLSPREEEKAQFKADYPEIFKGNEYFEEVPPFIQSHLNIILYYCFML